MILANDLEEQEEHFTVAPINLPVDLHHQQPTYNELQEMSPENEIPVMCKFKYTFWNTKYK